MIVFLLTNVTSTLKTRNIFALLFFSFAILAANKIAAQDSYKCTTDKSVPVAVVAIIPAYPAKAIIAKANGDVLVDVKIDFTGNVVEAIFVSGHELLKKTATVAALNWKFNNTSKNSIIRSTRLIFTFDLNSDNSNAQNKDEIIYNHHLKIYRPIINDDCFNNCSNKIQ